MDDKNLKCLAEFCILAQQLKSKDYPAAYNTACAMVEKLTAELTSEDATIEWYNDLYRLPYLIESAAQHNHADCGEYSQLAGLFERAAVSLQQGQPGESLDRIENAYVVMMVHAFRCCEEAKDRRNALRLREKAMEAAECLKKEYRLNCWLEYSMLCTAQLEDAEGTAISLAETAYEAATNALILQWRTPMEPRCCWQQQYAAMLVWMLWRKNLPVLQRMKWLLRLLTAKICGWMVGLFG